MLGNQAVTQLGDSRADMAITGPGRVDKQVALAVQPHRAIVEIGRTNPQDRIIDNHQLGMNINLRATGGERREGMKAPRMIHPGQRLQQPHPRIVHRLTLQPAMGRLGGDQHNFGRSGLSQPQGQSLGDSA